MTYSTQGAKYFDLAKTWGGGPKVSDATGYNSGYWFLGVTISVIPNYNGLLCAYNLPADRADSLVDMTDHCRSLAEDLSTVASLTPSSWWYGRMTDWSRSTEPYSNQKKGSVSSQLVSCPFRRLFLFCIIISRMAIRYDSVSLNSIPAFTVIHSMGPDADPDLDKLVNTKISCHDEESVQNMDYIVISI